MLKNLLKKNNLTKDKILSSIMDGYVDIKGYRIEEDGSKKMIYHDTGDNTVTDWMRQTILELLTGESLSNEGNQDPGDNKNITKYNNDSHGENTNMDGCCISDSQYFTDKEYKYKINSTVAGEIYAVWPTKVLFGTGKEYIDFATLQLENETENKTWFNEILNMYGNGDKTTAETQINNLIGGNDGSNGNFNNNYSASVGGQGIYDCDRGGLINSITVNDPETGDIFDTPASLSKRVGVVGAIKTIYLPEEKDDKIEYLNPGRSMSGKLLKSKYRGVGRPCFIYLNDSDWGNSTSSVSLSGDNDKFLNRITFNIKMPSQKGTSALEGLDTYYPYNGYTLKQVGLFNDALIQSVNNSEGKKVSSVAELMPCGTMLAVKNISHFTKTADVEYDITWTLTI